MDSFTNSRIITIFYFSQNLIEFFRTVLQLKQDINVKNKLHESRLKALNIPNMVERRKIVEI
ncbi:hypothetical protein BpHYR1_051727 [Brachionus plicatilis]|uniref:Uncharacterized protein n=1 Tax=Brachionus plicatilis TaxID=10195 RepID=A0A3M7QGF6_BRAPC|nr:hypothetical protein BpHYR1_051727 [Brachionus plicatilis]